MKRAVFLDRDGTILEHVAYMTDPAQVRIAPGAVEALRKLKAAGYLLVVCRLRLPALFLQNLQI